MKPPPLQTFPAIGAEPARRPTENRASATRAVRPQTTPLRTLTIQYSREVAQSEVGTLNSTNVRRCLETVPQDASRSLAHFRIDHCNSANCPDGQHQLCSLLWGNMGNCDLHALASQTFSMPYLRKNDLLKMGNSKLLPNFKMQQLRPTLRRLMGCVRFPPQMRAFPAIRIAPESRPSESGARMIKADLLRPPNLQHFRISRNGRTNRPRSAADRTLCVHR